MGGGASHIIPTHITQLKILRWGPATSTIELFYRLHNINIDPVREG